MARTTLIVSNSTDAHADAIVARMLERSLAVQRLNCDSFASTKHTWRIPSDKKCAADASWIQGDMETIWYRKVFFPAETDPVKSFISQEHEGLFESVLDQYGHCRWVSSRRSIANARPKISQLQRAKNIGFRIPDSIVTNDTAALKEFAESHSGSIVAKPIRAQVIGSDDGALVVGTRQLPSEHYESATTYAPCYAQERLKIRSEIRVVAFGGDLYSFRMTARKAVDDIKQLELPDIQHEACSIDPATSQAIRELMAQYGLEFAAIDLAVVDDAEPVFLELNPNGQWLWLQYMTGVNLIDPFIDFLRN